MKTVKEIIDAVLAAEGEEFTNDPSDSGGATKWGVTQRVAVKHGITDVSKLTRDQAYSIYYQEFVVAPKFDTILAIAPLTAAELVDTGVNCGPSVPSHWLQEWLNALNNQGASYPDIGEDGKLGAQTFNALRAYIKLRGPEGDAALAVALNCEQGVYYKNLSRRRQKDEKFVYGWLKNRVLDQVRDL